MAPKQSLSDSLNPASSITTNHGSLSWMARNPVAANLLMLILLLAGFTAMSNLKQEVFPEFNLDVIVISVPYPSASPLEIERGILVAVEESVRGLDGIKSIESSGYEGSGRITLELDNSADPNIVIGDVKNAVDSIRSFPDLAESPTVRLAAAKNSVVTLIVSGGENEHVLFNYAEQIRNQLLQRNDITQVDVVGERDSRIAVEIPEQILRAHSLTLRQVASKINSNALDVPGGEVRTAAGDVLLRTNGRREYAEEFAAINIISNTDGTVLRLSDIADIKEAFGNYGREGYFNSDPALRLRVYRVGKETPIGISNAVTDFLEKSEATRPEGIEVSIFDDDSLEYRDRINLLQRNALLGLFLVMLLLALFLEPRLAFWVTVGIPVCVIGSFIVLSLTGASINMISLFAFIITLGIVVDDAIVVGEMIYQKRESGIPHVQAAVEGAQQIAGPVCFAVLTNIVAFMPLMFVPGAEGRLFFQIPAVAISVLTLSLIESLYVLPTHLAKEKKEGWFIRTLGYPQRHFNPALHRFIENRYQPLVRKAVARPALSLSYGIATLILCYGIVAGGIVKFSFFPKIDQNASAAQIVLPFGSPLEQSRQVRQKLEAAAERAITRLNAEETTRGVFSRTGDSFGVFPAPTGGDGPHVISALVRLGPSSERSITASDLAKVWREEVGEIPGAESISITSELIGFGGPDIEIDLSHPSSDILKQAAKKLADALREFEGLSDINDGVAQGKPQLNMTIKPEAEALGMDSRYIAGFVRDSFYGAEALRQQRGRSEIQVLVRLPEHERERISSFENMIVIAPDGSEIALVDAVSISEGKSNTSINRYNGRRIVRVTASVVDGASISANDVVTVLKSDVLPDLKALYPELGFALEGEQKTQSESLGSIFSGFAIAIFVIYGLLAIPFKSYIQPLIIMSIIPFGFVGALLGHLLLGYDISIISLLGIVALSGVVVNDSLVFVVAANRLRGEGYSAYEAVCNAGMKRFRPILLTSLTTFFGLLPMIFETSAQARFLIPMAVSLGFGILLATVFMLLLIPVIYLLVARLSHFLSPSH